MVPRVVSIHVGKAAPLRGNEKRQSAIDKKPVTGPVRIGEFGAEGDVQADMRHHGGRFKALCVYASEYYPGWRAETGSNMPLGSFGENLALEGLLDHEVCLGDVYTLGTARVQVSGPRHPCANLTFHWNSKGFHQLVRREMKTGFYLRVLVEGVAEAGCELVLNERPAPAWNLVRFWETLDADPISAADVDEVCAFEFVDDDCKRWLRTRLAKAQ